MCAEQDNLCVVLLIILAVRKLGHLNIKTKMFDFEARVLIDRLARVFASQPIRMRASKSNIFVSMLRWPNFFTASIILLLLLYTIQYSIALLYTIQYSIAIAIQYIQSCRIYIRTIARKIS